jgi:hypothetical protein
VSVFLTPMATHGPTLGGIVRTVFFSTYALWLGNSLIRRLKK